MSIYTEAEHAIALSDTTYWIDHPPIRKEERYAFGRYHFRLKDYSEAYHWFSLSADAGCKEAWFDMGICLREKVLNENETAPDSAALCQSCFTNAFSYYKEQCLQPEHSSEDLYRLAYLYRYGLGTPADVTNAFSLFEEVTVLHANLSASDFDVCCNYSYEGSAVSVPTDVCKLPLGDSYYELAKYYAKGLAPATTDIPKARSLLKKAYEFHCEKALFYDYSHFCKDFVCYEYQDDIKELYSYHIGLLVRVSEVHPSRKAYERIIALYQAGYPGDFGERHTAFTQKAERFEKKRDALPIN